MTRIVRAGERFRSEQQGIVSWHVFSAGGHYDPLRLGVGTLVGVDEHVVMPGAGFTSHAHRGVDIATVVLAGTLRHTDGHGRTVVVGAGDSMLQVAGSGLRHAEVNDGAGELRFLQLTALGGDGASGVSAARPPFTLGGGLLDERPEGRHDAAFAYVLEGSWSVEDATPDAPGGTTLGPGDAVWDARHVTGHGAVLIWTAG